MLLYTSQIGKNLKSHKTPSVVKNAGNETFHQLSVYIRLQKNRHIFISLISVCLTLCHVTLPLHCQVVEYISPVFESGLSHMTCFGQWHFYKHDESKGLKFFCSLEFVLSYCQDLSFLPPCEEAGAGLLNDARPCRERLQLFQLSNYHS